MLLENVRGYASNESTYESHKYPSQGLKEKLSFVALPIKQCLQYEGRDLTITAFHYWMR